MASTLPETDQTCRDAGRGAWPCGAWVAGEVRARYQGRYLICENLDTDRYRRIVGRCFLDGDDIARDLVTSGLAFAYRRYSRDYVRDETRAAHRRQGLHATGVTSPEAFRRAKRTEMVPARMGCTIKGNIARDGERIYHMPGQSWYEATQISARQGERWFCTEAEARLAGWRRAKR